MKFKLSKESVKQLRGIVSNEANEFVQEQAEEVISFESNPMEYILNKYPSLTEKSINLYSDRQYTFIVDRSLTKTQIKFVIENIFNVNIINVSTAMLPPKTRRVGKFRGKRTQYKKVFVKLKVGDTITELFN